MKLNLPGRRSIAWALQVRKTAQVCDLASFCSFGAKRSETEPAGEYALEAAVGEEDARHRHSGGASGPPADCVAAATSFRVAAGTSFG